MLWHGRCPLEPVGWSAGAVKIEVIYSMLSSFWAFGGAKPYILHMGRSVLCFSGLRAVICSSTEWPGAAETLRLAGATAEGLRNGSVRAPWVCTWPLCPETTKSITSLNRWWFLKQIRVAQKILIQLLEYCTVVFYATWKSSYQIPPSPSRWQQNTSLAVRDCFLNGFQKNITCPAWLLLKRLELLL